MAEVIDMASSGRQCAVESEAFGRTQTRKSFRNFERSAREHGNATAEEERLLEYQYIDIWRLWAKCDGFRTIRNEERESFIYNGLEIYSVIWFDSYVFISEY